jgi:uncharacterized membrane protein YfcA
MPLALCDLFKEGSPLRVLSGFYLFGFAGGFFKSWQQHVPFRDAVASAGVAALAGTIAGALVNEFVGQGHVYLSLAVAGLAAWLGGKALDKLADIGWTIVDRRIPGAAPAAVPVTNPQP